MIGYHIKKFWRIYLGYNITKFLALKNHIMICYPLQDLDIKYPNFIEANGQEWQNCFQLSILGTFFIVPSNFLPYEG